MVAVISRMAAPSSTSVAGAGPLRTTLLRAGRDGESHQGTVESVQRPAEHRDDACQPASSLLLIPGLRTARRAAAHRTGRNPVGSGPGGNDSIAAAENRRPGARDRAQNPGLLQQRLPVETPVRRRLVGTALLNHILRQQSSSRTRQPGRNSPSEAAEHSSQPFPAVRHQELSSSQLNPKKNPFSYLPNHHSPTSGEKIGLKLSNTEGTEQHLWKPICADK